MVNTSQMLAVIIIHLAQGPENVLYFISRVFLFLFQMLPIVVISTCILQLAFLGLGIWDLMCSESVRVYFAYWYAVIQGNLKCLTKIKIKLKTKIW